MSPIHAASRGGARDGVPQQQQQAVRVAGHAAAIDEGRPPPPLVARLSSKYTTSEHGLGGPSAMPKRTPVPAPLQVLEEAKDVWQSARLDMAQSPQMQDAVQVIQRAFRQYRERKRLKFQGLIDGNKLKRIKQIQKTRGRLRDILLFVVFLFFLTLASVGTFQDQDIFNLTRNLEEVLFEEEFEESMAHVRKNFHDIVTIQEMHQWMAGPLLNALYAGESWNGTDHNPYPGRLFGASYVLMGGVRITQLRVKERECVRGPVAQINFGRWPVRCFGDSEGSFDMSVESTEPFGNHDRPFAWDGGPWLLGVNYTESQAPPRSGIAAWTGSVRTGSNRFFAPGGYPVMLPNHDGTEASKIIDELDAYQYWDVQTRAIFIDFTFYSPMMNYWVGVHVDLEFPKAGGVIPSHQVTPLRLYTWAESDRTHLMVFEALVAAFYAYFLGNEIVAVWRDGLRSRLRLHIFLHNLNVLFYLLVWATRAFSLLSLPPAETLNAGSNEFYDFTRGLGMKATSVHFAALNVFLCWFKLVSFLSYVPKFALVTGTLSRAASSVSNFAIIFLVVLYGFSSCFMVMFGNRLGDFRNLTHSGLSLLRSLLGDFDLGELSRGQYFWGPLLFVLYVCLAVFVVLNILIAIISDAYNDEIEELAHSEDVRIYHEMVAYLVHVGRENKLVGAFVRCFGLGRNIRNVAHMVTHHHIGEAITRRASHLTHRSTTSASTNSRGGFKRTMSRMLPSFIVRKRKIADRRARRLSQATEASGAGSLGTAGRRSSTGTYARYLASHGLSGHAPTLAVPTTSGGSVRETKGAPVGETEESLVGSARPPVAGWAPSGEAATGGSPARTTPMPRRHRPGIGPSLVRSQSPADALASTIMGQMAARRVARRMVDRLSTRAGSTKNKLAAISNRQMVIADDGAIIGDADSVADTLLNLSDDDLLRTSTRSLRGSPHGSTRSYRGLGAQQQNSSAADTEGRGTRHWVDVSAAAEQQMRAEYGAGVASGPRAAPPAAAAPAAGRGRSGTGASEHARGGATGGERTDDLLAMLPGSPERSGLSSRATPSARRLPPTTRAPTAAAHVAVGVAPRQRVDTDGVTRVV